MFPLGQLESECEATILITAAQKAFHDEVLPAADPAVDAELAAELAVEAPLAAELAVEAPLAAEVAHVVPEPLRISGAKSSASANASAP
jgi:hypothetical protein